MMESAYQPKQVEDRIYKMWEEKGYFSGSPNRAKKPFSLVIPPPNVTGILHMGHVLDNTPQDIMVRFNRMKGYETVWVPGTDHAGIATQNAVEKRLQEEKSSRHLLGREKFVERVWQWKEQYGGAIIQQLKKLGCSCDWSRLRFTMDKAYSDAVIEVFVRLYEKGLIYRGNYIINWCPRCQTALSDEEVEHEEIEGGLYWIKYPFKENKDEYVIVATTRPETMLGDTAVAVHPADERYKKLIGKTLILPIVQREISIIADEIVERDFGSGAVKVTPAHDPNDFLMGQKHNLEFINVMAPDAKMNENAGEYKGLDRLECRKRIIKRLTEEGLLEKQEKYIHSVGHCYRCETMIEPYLSLQWFVKMKPLAEPAIKSAIDKDVRFFPEHWTKTYLNWLGNIRDWCISRQLWWGHRLPVWYCAQCHPELHTRLDPRGGKLEKDKPIPLAHFDIPLGDINILSHIEPIVSKEKPICKQCNSSNLMVQDPQVLDTWFSSWLWPFAVFGWPSETEDLKYFYPTTVLNSGKDIIFFWVSRMIMAGLEFAGSVPFRDVYIHGIARDKQGRKLSKSLGNSPDPLKLIDQYGADALRFGIMANIPLGGDINLSDEVYESGRNFCNKLWNASRLILTSLNNGIKQDSSDNQFNPLNPVVSFEDRWILSRLNTTIRDYTNALETYDFSEAAHLIYHFFWSDLCDWYLEIIKPRLYGKEQRAKSIEDSENSKTGVYTERSECAIRSMLPHIFSNLLRMLHPFIPFITEELWQKFREKYKDDFNSEAIIVAQWSQSDTSLIDSEAEKTMEVLIDIIRGVRNIRNKMNIEKKQPLTLIISAESEETLEGIKRHEDLIKHQANLNKMELGIKPPQPKHSATEIVGLLKLFVPLEGVIDIEIEKKRLQCRLTRIEEQLESVKQKLAKEDFKTRAPQAVVQKETQKLEELSQQYSNLQESLQKFN